MTTVTIYINNYADRLSNKFNLIPNKYIVPSTLNTIINTTIVKINRQIIKERISIDGSKFLKLHNNNIILHLTRNFQNFVQKKETWSTFIQTFKLVARDTRCNLNSTTIFSTSDGAAIRAKQARNITYYVVRQITRMALAQSSSTSWDEPNARHLPSKIEKRVRSKGISTSDDCDRER